MPLIEALGWIAAAWTGHIALPVADAIDNYNRDFAIAVDAKHSCWDRIGGTEGEYGSPEHYSLDLACNYMLVKTTEEGTVTNWHLIRSE